MKRTLLSIAAAAFAASAALAADAVVATTTTDTAGSGTITEYSPGKTFIVKESSGPVTYHYGDKVTYVTRSGKTLSDDEVRTRIKVGSPVRYHYRTDGDRRMISRVEIDD